MRSTGSPQPCQEGLDVGRLEQLILALQAGTDLLDLGGEGVLDGPGLCLLHQLLEERVASQTCS